MRRESHFSPNASQLTFFLLVYTAVCQQMRFLVFNSTEKTACFVFNPMNTREMFEFFKLRVNLNLHIKQNR